MPLENNLDNPGILQEAGGKLPPVDTSFADVALPPEGVQYARIAGVNTNAAISSTVSIEQIKYSIQLKYPRINELPEFDEVHSKDEPIYLIGGGPSLKDTLDDLRKPGFIPGPTMACGSVYDYCVENGVIPDYCSLCDPDEVMARYITKANRHTLFLVSSACHASVFKKLRGYNIAIWHCHSEDYEKSIPEFGEEYYAVGGGCTVGLRSISIAMIFGYSNIHLLGFDSCMSDDDHHAYGFETDTEELGKIYPIRIGFNIPGDKVYKVAGYQLAQADHFKAFYKAFRKYFTPTFHGPGLLSDVFKAIQNGTYIVDVAKLNGTAGVQL